MTDPIKDLGKAAEAYIDASAEDGKRAGAAFEALLGKYGAALEADALTEQEKTALHGEWQEWKRDSAELTQTGYSYWQFVQNKDERDFADAAAYAAGNPEEVDAQALRIAAPIPVPDDQANEEHAMIDSGRYTLMVKNNQLVRAFDKATGEEQMLHANHEDAGQLAVPLSASPAPAVALEDGTFVVFAEHEIMVVKYDKQEGDYGDAFSFPVDGDAPIAERVKVHEFEIVPSGTASDAPDDGNS